MEIIHISQYIYDLCMYVLKPIAPFLMIWSKQKEENRKVFFLLLEQRALTFQRDQNADRSSKF